MAKRRNKLAPQLAEDQKKFKADIKKILVIASNEAVNFFQDNFKREGFLDRRVRTWKSRKVIDPGRGILIGKGGGAKLFDSIARTGLSYRKVTIGIKGEAIQKYASVHNFGLRSGRGKGFKMPKRKFMGESRVLNKKIVRLIKSRIKKIL